MNNKKTDSNNMGIGSLLTIAFVILKLCSVIDWSWLWVLSPFWISLFLKMVIFLVLKAFEEKS